MNKKAPARPVQVLLGLLSHGVNQNVTGVACTARYRGLALRVGTEQPYPAPEFFRCIDSQAFQRCTLGPVFKHGAEQVAVVGGFGQVKLGNKAGNEPLDILEKIKCNLTQWIIMIRIKCIILCMEWYTSFVLK